jgi:hypothetical protein
MTVMAEHQLTDLGSGPGTSGVRPLLRSHVGNMSGRPRPGCRTEWWCDGQHYTDDNEGLIEHRRQVAEMSLDYDDTIIEVLVVSLEDTASERAQAPHATVRTYEHGNRGVIYHEASLLSFRAAEQMADVLAALGEGRWLADAFRVAQGLLDIIEAPDKIRAARAAHT